MTPDQPTQPVAEALTAAEEAQEAERLLRLVANRQVPDRNVITGMTVGHLRRALDAARSQPIADTTASPGYCNGRFCDVRCGVPCGHADCDRCADTTAPRALDRIDALRKVIDRAVDGLNYAWSQTGEASWPVEAVITDLQKARTEDDIAQGRDWPPAIDRAIGAAGSPTAPRALGEDDARLRLLAHEAMSDGWYEAGFFRAFIDDDDADVFSEADARFMAAMSPQVALRLIDRAIAAAGEGRDSDRDGGLDAGLVADAMKWRAAEAEGHTVDFTESGYGLQHPPSCRPNLIGCRFNVFLADYGEPVMAPGRYRMTWADGDDMPAFDGVDR